MKIFFLEQNFNIYVDRKTSAPDQNVNIYLDRETSTPEQKVFSPPDSLPSQPTLGSSPVKQTLQGLINNNVEFEDIFKHVVV